MNFTIEFVKKRIKEEMEKQGIQQNELAEKINKSPQWLNQQLGRNKTLDLAKLVKITDGLEITVDDLLPENKRNNPGITLEEHLRFIINEEINKNK